MKTKKHDFIEIEYTGKIQETNQIFDVTDKKTAEKLNLPKKGPVRICLGEGHIIEGLDKTLIDKEIGKSYKIVLPPEKAFGKKDAKMIKLVPAAIFKKQELKPFPGMRINVDGLLATVRSVSGGRILIDFNHPLAGKTLEYILKITKKLTTTEDKLETLFKNLLNIDKAKFKLEENNLKIEESVPEKIQKEFTKKIQELINSIKNVTYVNSNQKTSSRT